MANVHCDKCKKNIEIKLKEKKHGKGVTETYFTCPHCKARYTAFVLNAEARRLQREIKGWHHTSITSTDEVEKKDATKRLAVTRYELEKLMGELKESVLKGGE